MDGNALKEHMAKILRQPVSRFRDEEELTNLVTDSFVLVDMVIELQEEFGLFLVQDDLKGVKTVGDLVAVFQQHASR